MLSCVLKAGSLQMCLQGPKSPIWNFFLVSAMAVPYFEHFLFLIEVIKLEAFSFSFAVLICPSLSFFSLTRTTPK